MSTQSWSADPQSVMELVGLLKSSISPNQSERMTSMESLKTFELQPEFLNYLCYILIEGETDQNLTSNFSANELSTYRASAGMLLKNTLLNQQSLLKHNIEYVKNNIVHGLYNSTNALVANVTGIVITTLFSAHYRQHRNDPTGYQMLLQLLELASNGNVGAIKALSKIVEDNGQFFQVDWTGMNGEQIKPIETLIESFLRFIKASNENSIIRSESLKCMNFIIALQNQFFVVKLDEFLAILFGLAENDHHDDVRIQICVSFTQLLQVRPDKLIDYLDGIVNFCLHIIGTVDDEKVAIEACEFLFEFVNNTLVPKHILQPYVPQLVPVLLAKMVYDNDTIMVLESHNEDDAYLEDKDEDIKPMAPRIVKRKDVANADASTGANNEDDEDDEDEDDGEIDSVWTLRKCSAATLDSLTTALPRDVIEIAFPFLREHLTSEKWYVREATILALGAMSEGGMKYFNDQLPALIPFLVEQIKDPWAPIRKIVCWTLSRFSPWVLKDHTEFMIPVLEPVVNTLVDKKKDVQEAAISSTAVFIENCDPELIETLLYNDLLASFDKCFQLYKKKNLIILYDAVGRFAEKVLLDDNGMQVILPHLINKWTSLPDNDKELWPLLECLSCVASSLGEKFLPMAPDVFSRAYRILCHCVELERKAHQDPTIMVPEKDFTITSIDLIDGLVQGLEAQSQALLFPNNDNSILRIMLECLQDPVHEVRQSTFALLGDIVTFHSPQVLSGYLQQFLKFIGTEIIHNDDPDGVSSMINAIWCLGLISERIDLSEYVIDMSRILLDLFTTTLQDVDISVMENIAITIGRMSITHPEVFTSGQFAADNVWSRWCDSVANVESLEEKSSAYMGFLKILNLMGEQAQISSNTMVKIIDGLSNNVEAQAFAEEVLDFLMKHSAQIQSLNLSQTQIAFLQQFSN
ncbi:hypothetical protein KAFR_0C00900 [Kazachstania africana CBS 2517]|uniref:Importin N-terminal domain-containing protein n=1 Tax=Kazachstania africana (strain ATCC 22294 / BCRC 22015 / CBS 2517 / CECT 1963 / NBRC 1671 / NRRL Y-8276) TaxID=1071382 RepID=H2ART5_KAZAF|nr:hypothetical protein KAFR_0C00900 [Kazachstania africana CBS 2517]CCF57085.1 hypothetical protein KAFR_0C00900 [Kazachstania africana CBS 2517]